MLPAALRAPQRSFHNHRPFGGVPGRESSRGFCGSPRREPSWRFALFWLRRRVLQKREWKAGI
jgi:hypothetical protein